MCQMYHIMQKQVQNSWLWLVLIMLSCQVSFAQGPGKKAFDTAEGHRRNNNCDQAVKSYSEAIQAEPNNYKYYFRKAQCEMKLRNYADAKTSLENAARVNRNFSAAYTTLAKIYTKENDYVRAIENYNKAFEVEGDQDKRLTIKLKVVKLYLSKLGKPAEASAELGKVKGTFGSDPRVTYYEAEILGANGQWQQALDIYKSTYAKYVSLGLGGSPEAMNCRVGIGLAHCKLGNTAGYQEQLNGLKGENVNYAKRLESKCKGASGMNKEYALAKSYLSAGAYDEAMQWCNKGLEANKNSIGYQLAAMIYQRRGELTQAAQHYAKAAELETDAVKKLGIYKRMIKVQYNSKDYSGALSSANAILANAAEANNPQILLIKAQAEYKLGQYGASVASAEKGRANVPPVKERQALYNFTIGLAAKKAGDKAKAKEAFTKAGEVKKFSTAAKEEAKSLGAQ